MLPEYLDLELNRYIARSQVLLRAGYPVIDICYLYGEGAPLRPNTRIPEIPAGYMFDFCPAELVLKARYEGGRLALPSGMEYRALLLPPDEAMTLPMLQAVERLVDAGCPVAGLKPVRSPSFRGGSDTDAAVKTLADRLWKDKIYAVYDEQTLRKQSDSVSTDSEKTRFIPTKMAEVLRAIGLEPDFRSSVDSVLAIHRRFEGKDIYFLSRKGTPISAMCSFRVEPGGKPSVWNPRTGTINEAAVAEPTQTGVQMKIDFEENGSCFVVFSEKPKAK